MLKEQKPMAQLFEEIKPILMRKRCFFQIYFKKAKDKKPAILPSIYDYKIFKSKLFLAAIFFCLNNSVTMWQVFCLLSRQVKKKIVSLN